MQTWLISIRCFLSGAILLAALQCIAAEPTTRPLPRLETGMHTAIIRRIATDAAGRWAVTASDDKTARVWEVASGRQLVVLRPPQDVGNEGKLYAVALSPDGAVVAVGGWTGWDWDKEDAIYLFDRASGRLLRRLPGLPSVVIHLAFSPDGRWLAASLCGANGVRIFEATRGEETGRDAAYGGASYSVHFSPDGRRLLTTSEDGQVRLYAVNDGKLGQPTRASPGGGQGPLRRPVLPGWPPYCRWLRRQHRSTGAGRQDPEGGGPAQHRWCGQRRPRLSRLECRRPFPRGWRAVG